MNRYEERLRLLTIFLSNTHLDENIRKQLEEEKHELLKILKGEEKWNKNTIKQHKN